MRFLVNLLTNYIELVKNGKLFLSHHTFREHNDGSTVAVAEEDMIHESLDVF